MYQKAHEQMLQETVTFDTGTIVTYYTWYCKGFSGKSQVQMIHSDVSNVT